MCRVQAEKQIKIIAYQINMNQISHQDTKVMRKKALCDFVAFWDKKAKFVS